MMRYKSKNTSKALSLTTISLAVVLGITGCNSGGGTNNTDGNIGLDDNNEQPSLSPSNFILSNNGPSNVGTTNLIDENAVTLKTFTSGNNEGVDINKLGHLVHAGDASVASLRTVCHIQNRADGASYDSNIDRELTGSSTGLVNPKGIDHSEKMGLVFVADFNAMQVSIYGDQAAGDVMPVATTITDATPWDLVYDDDNDRLYVALTDGTVAVYDDFVESDFAATPARVITPSDEAGMKVSVNIHGIVLDKSTNTLVLSDVGDAEDITDGSIFVINNADSADGNITVARTIAGPTTMLGNPVDITLTGTDLRVAEKSNDAILVFSDIYNGESGDIAPDLITSTEKPESLVEVPESYQLVDVSDITDGSADIISVAVSSNPATPGATSNMIASFDASLTSNSGSYDTQRTQESSTFDAAGNSYTTFDGDASGILISTKVATNRSDGTYNPSYDRVISGSNTGLVEPKGLDVASQAGMILVAENNETTPGILIYSSCASGNVSPVLKLSTSDLARPWDVDYDAQTDKAFVALTDGTIAVFDEVLANINAGVTDITAESRLIVPATAGAPLQAPTNIHGIDYDPSSDSLIVSDVGSADDITDGKIYVMNDAAAASGVTDISVSISGANTNLGNPVDIMYTGSHLYVAEKSNNLVMRFDNILTSSGGDIVPDLSISYTAPESVAIVPASLQAH
ncbi:hypothetical protein ACPUVO_12085 [Pseudocolwellia sp. HL-MZ19]|uniref:hypothetical protein n=1 Tax=Pseudocolwellia sp. HL-MZ19 TaxID=3400846 RepID=UPI003CE6AAF8